MEAVQFRPSESDRPGTAPNQGVESSTDTLTVDEILQLYLEIHILRTSKSHETHCTTRKVIRNIRKMAVKVGDRLVPFVSLPADVCSRKHIIQLQLDASDRPHPANQMLRVLRAAFGFVIRKEFFEGKNPASGIRELPTPKTSKAVREETIVGLLDVIDRLEASGELPSVYADYFRIAFATGLRPCSVRALHLQNIDLALGTLSIIQRVIARS
ncbi:MAG: hypothetical protein HC927_02505 [Deltaproteobacteria bacterium]|nr:hypothetical protein [Deltaproteobacteria bacterium]